MLNCSLAKKVIPFSFFLYDLTINLQKKNLVTKMFYMSVSV